MCQWSIFENHFFFIYLVIGPKYWRVKGWKPFIIPVLDTTKMGFYEITQYWSIKILDGKYLKMNFHRSLQWRSGNIYSEVCVQWILWIENRKAIDISMIPESIESSLLYVFTLIPVHLGFLDLELWLNKKIINWLSLFQFRSEQNWQMWIWQSSKWSWITILVPSQSNKLSDCTAIKIVSCQI